MMIITISRFPEMIPLNSRPFIKSEMTSVKRSTSVKYSNSNKCNFAILFFSYIRLN